jgi:hypothetical protein
MKKNGFSLVEALVGVAILALGIMGALFMNEQMGKSNKGSRDGLNYALFRNQVLIYMSSDLVWKYTLQGALNSGMACWLNQDQVAIGPRNCAGKSGDLVIYDIKGNVQYDFTAADAGLSTQGKPCTGFVPAPAAGNAACPMKLNLKWTAVCEAGDPECVNPLIRVDGNFVFNGAQGQTAPPDIRLNFSSYHYLKYCPVQTMGWALADTGVAPATTTTLNQVISGNVGKTFSTGSARMSQRATPCRQADIAFKENMNATVPGPLTISDPENRSQVCLFDETANQCRFEFLRDTVGGVRSFRLRYGGTTDVFTMPASMAITDNTIFAFKVRRNRVDFAVDGKVIYSWFQKITYPFRLQLLPASKSYSPQGFYNIQMDVRD